MSDTFTVEIGKKPSNLKVNGSNQTKQPKHREPKSAKVAYVSGRTSAKVAYVSGRTSAKVAYASGRLVLV